LEGAIRTCVDGVVSHHTCRSVFRHGLCVQVPKSHDKAKHEPSKVPSKATIAIVSGFLDSIRLISTNRRTGENRLPK